MTQKDNIWAGYDVDYITSYDVNSLVKKIQSQESIVTLFGASAQARYAIAALESRGIDVSYVCDSNEQKREQQFCGFEITSLANLAQERSNACVFICSGFPGPMLSTLESLGFEDVFSCIPLFDNTDFSELEVNNDGLKQHKSIQDIDRDIAVYNLEFMTFVSKLRTEELKLQSIDIMITEACSMKCKDCSNLMQYYLKPKGADFSILFESVEKIMKSVDWVYEFRVLGGEPFMVKDIHKVINKLLSYKNAGEIIIYTNATIVPKNKKLACLKNKKVLIDISNYGSHSRNYKKLLQVFDTEGISYTTKVPKWTDSGRILPYQDRTEKQLKDLFFNCCTNDVLTLLHGKLYHCPFSANATNLKAIPYDNDDVIDILEEEGNQLRQKIEQFYKKKDYLTACSYCNGRDYNTPNIEVAIQTKKSLRIPQTFSY